MKKIFIICLLWFVFAACSHAVLEEIGVPGDLTRENDPDFVETHTIEIINVEQGHIRITDDQGETWQDIGRVIYPCGKVNDQGYTASKWVKKGEVAATSVNAIHIKAGYNKKDDRGVIFSILPKEYSKVPRNYNSYYSPTASILTDIPAGTSIFGGWESPAVGNIVSACHNESLEDGNEASYFVPGSSDQFWITVSRPKVSPQQIVFENRFGGRVTMRYLDGEEKIIGQVYKPVLGVGRFAGTKYAEVGRIRANHSAVIDISTSPLNLIGGFQIIPSYHGMSKEMIYARAKTQWMVVGPAGVEDPAIEGSAPLFKYFLRPVYVESTLEEKYWDDILLTKFLVEVKYKDNDDWQPLPRFTLNPKAALPTWADRALKNVTHFRILFPIN